MSRIYDASQWKKDSKKRMDSQEHEDDDLYSIQVQIPSLCQDRTASWVRTVNGVDKYVTESMITKEEEDIASWKNRC